MAKETAKSVAKPAVKDKEKEKKLSFGKKFTRFFKDLRSEVKKVVWPSKKQVKNNTFVVLAFMAVTAAFVWIFDLAFTTLLKLALG